METFLKEFQQLKIQLKEIKSATGNFDDSKVIGTGGFGKVYGGKLSHFLGRIIVAFKCLDRRFGQGAPEFLKEIMMLSRYTHENLVSLLGYCDEAGEKILIYEYASNGSLDLHLRSTTFTWIQRLKVCLDAARGLSYLHDDKGTQQRILHRDIKSSNILLDDNWNAKVSDMGLSKLGPANQQYTAIITNVVGTIGYLDPMYMESGILSKESDVYSFGVVLFEVLCGRLCFENSNGRFLSLVHTWKQSYKQRKLDDTIFQDLMQEMDPRSLKTFSRIAFQCLHENREARPTMSLVVEKLKTALEFQEKYEWMKHPQDYEKINRIAVHPLKYKSKTELKSCLSKGILLNAGKTWFSLNKNGEHCEMISAADCLIPTAQASTFDEYHSNCTSIYL
ncbi:receptor-like protein kinase ANXUR2 [Bidens hawaiensis]|uniref:receptor-like protein kinase ANXUR2 n=1 Tax=Bidens hawaiensis TaxID=980011 RepID=UPI00404B4ADF